MRLIIGLGNPGFRYRNTRHNVGFLVIKSLAQKLFAFFWKTAYKGKLTKAKIDGGELFLFMPHTYINLSGDAISEIINDKKIPISDILVICDDVNLELGQLRLRLKGSSGGHKGLESIIASLGTEEFPRLRIGIGKPDNTNLAEYVLSPFDISQKEILSEVIEKACMCVLAYIKDGPEQAMARFNKG